MRRARATALLGLLLLGQLAGAAQSAPAARWVVAWSSPLAPPLEAAGSSAPSATTVRNAVRVSAGGTAIRLRVANDDGRIPLRVGAATVGRSAAGPALVPGSIFPASFGGRPSVTVPAGRHLYSDPIRMAVAAGEDLAVSVFVPAQVNPVDNGTAWTSSWSAPDGSGDATDDASGAGFLPTMPLSTAYLGAVDVLTNEVAGAVVVLGDSITQGALTVPGSHTVWTDVLAQRLRGRLAVANAGIAGNDVTTDQSRDGSGYGQSALQRLERDVLSQSGVRAVIVAEGVNDLSHGCGTPVGVGCPTARIVAALRTLAARAHARGVRVLGATVTPVKGQSDYDSPAQLATRQAVNDWVRSTSAYDAVVDLDLALRWGGVDSDRLRPEHDSGDHLHPSQLGHRAMADAVDLRRLSGR